MSQPYRRGTPVSFLVGTDWWPGVVRAVRKITPGFKNPVYEYIVRELGTENLFEVKQDQIRKEPLRPIIEPEETGSCDPFYGED